MLSLGCSRVLGNVWLRVTHRDYCIMNGDVFVLILTDAVARLSMFESSRVHFYLEQFRTDLTVPVDVSSYPIENSTCEMPSTCLVESG